jgi:hypothetical protein
MTAPSEPFGSSRLSFAISSQTVSFFPACLSLPLSIGLYVFLIAFIHPPLIRRLSVFPFGPTDWAGLTTRIQPGRHALQMKGVSALAKDDGAFVSGKFNARCHTFKGRLTDSTYFVFTSGIPSPSGDAVKAFDADAESSRGGGGVRRHCGTFGGIVRSGGAVKDSGVAGSFARCHRVSFWRVGECGRDGME